MYGNVRYITSKRSIKKTQLFIYKYPQFLFSDFIIIQLKIREIEKKNTYSSVHAPERRVEETQVRSCCESIEENLGVGPEGVASWGYLHPGVEDFSRHPS